MILVASGCDEQSSAREGSSTPTAEGCVGEKCDDEQQSACWTSEPTTRELIDSGICDELRALEPALLDVEEGQGEALFHIVDGGGCVAIVGNPGIDTEDCPAGNGYCAFEYDVAPLIGEGQPLADVVRDEAAAADACHFVSIAQRRCRGELSPSSDTCDTPSSCTPGLEIDCLEYAPPWLSGAPQFPAPQSRCTGVTVNGIGYANTLSHEYVDVCSGDTSTVAIAACDVFGQHHSAMDVGLCEVLTTCVEPAIECLGTGGVDVGGRTLQRYAFPSGEQAIGVDLVCGTTQTEGNHQDEICRAVDINVTANGGNLEGRSDPESNLPPEFVAVMEQCGLRWGGRFNGTYEVPGVGCDPMHFDYMGSCSRPSPPPTAFCGN